MTAGAYTIGIRERIMDLVFLIGIVFKGIDGALELIGGGVLLVFSPDRLIGVARWLTAPELAEDPHDALANFLLHSVVHLGAKTTTFLAFYLLIHGVVKVVIVWALLRGTRRVYPWAIAALTAFLGYQLYELVVAPTVSVLLLTIFDAIIIALTWREWRHDRTLHATWHSTVNWILRRSTQPEPSTH